MEPLYESTITCICCEMDFVTSRVRPSFKKAISMDSDFCGHYRNDINPDYYVVRVCPQCGFASTENGFEQLSEQQKKQYFDQVGSSWKMQSYGGERTLQDALVCYKLALISAQATNAPDRNIAAILHHIAWLYRYQHDTEQEKRFLSFALQSYIKVYEQEEVSLNNARLIFIIGDLNRRVGNDNEAVRWYSRIINDKKIMDAAMIQAARAAWQQLRLDHEERRAQGLVDKDLEEAE